MDMKKEILIAGAFFGCMILYTTQALAVASAKNGDGNMTVSPTVVIAGTTNSYVFSFVSQKKTFDPGSQATIQIPLGWSAPQTSNPSGPGFISVAPVLSGSAASVSGTSGDGPWTVSISFSTTQRRGGFTLNYNQASAPTNGNVYRFTTQDMQNGGVMRTLKTGSPTVTVDNPAKTNTTTSFVSSLNPSTYGDWVVFTAQVSAPDQTNLTGTITFLNGDVVMGISPLNSQGQATVTTNRFSVLDSPAWITAQYSGNSNHNASVSAILTQNVNPATVTLSGLAALDKTYDGTTTSSLNTNSLSISGALPGDDVAPDASPATASFADASVGSQKPVTVTGLALAGADGGNYVIAPVSLLANILPAPLLVKANDTNRVYGVANPAFTASYNGFVPGEDTSVLKGNPAFTTTANINSPANGTYPITVTAGNLSSANYNFTFASGQLTITPASGLPQKIISITQRADGAMVLNCGGAANRSYLLLATTDLQSNSWSTLATNTTDSAGLMTCIDVGATNFPSRFYRTALP
jgi:hypothetical protein